VPLSPIPERFAIVLQDSVRAWTVVTVERALTVTTASRANAATTSPVNTALRLETKVLFTSVGLLWLCFIFIGFAGCLVTLLLETPGDRVFLVMCVFLCCYQYYG